MVVPVLPVADEHVQGPVGVAGHEVRRGRGERHVPPVAGDRRLGGRAAGEPAAHPLRDERGGAGRRGQPGVRGRRAPTTRGRASRPATGAGASNRSARPIGPDPDAAAPQGRRYPE